MDIRTLSFWVFALVVLQLVNSESASNAPNDVLPSESKSVGWMRNAQNILAGPAGHMMVQFAKEFITRSTGSSQILSLNLGNLFILVLLKALIFAVGMIGAGNWSHYARRIDTEESVFLPGETPLLIGYLAAQGSGRDGCLHKASCRSPRLAFEYARAAKAILNGIEMFQGKITERERYQNLIDLVEKSAYDGYKGAPCDLIYRCDLQT